MENKNLWQLKRFHFALWTPISLSIIIALVIWYNDNYIWDFTAESFNYSLHIYKFPLGVLALVFPSVALIAALHRSDQTKKQIHEVEQKNRTDMYLAHYKYFCEHIEQAESSITKKFEVDPKERSLTRKPSISIHKLSLYKSLFPNNSLTTGISSRASVYLINIYEVLESISDQIIELNSLLINDDCIVETINSISHICNDLSKLNALLYFKSKNESMFYTSRTKPHLRYIDSETPPLPDDIIFSSHQELFNICLAFANIYNSIAEISGNEHAYFDTFSIEDVFSHLDNQKAKNFRSCLRYITISEEIYDLSNKSYPFPEVTP